MQHTKKNRTEIQCLRCVAICAVLGFHLYPKFVPQGFLGVDVFFVLSGYLMTMILKFSPTKTLSINVCLDFYRRRLKRLMPAYLCAILLTIILGTFILTSLDFIFLQLDGLLAIVFGTNFQALMKNEDYFQLVATKKFLLHTWSLSVEVQYYFAAPFVLAWIASSKHPIYMTMFLSFISWCFQALYMTDESLSFYSTPARLWQFLLGTLVYHIEQKRYATCTNSYDLNSETETMLSSSSISIQPKILIYEQRVSHIQIISVVFLVSICFMPSVSTHVFYKTAIRTTATIITAYIVYLGPPKLPDSIVTKLILYLGDISYSVYLIHWPLEVFTQYQYPNIGNRHILLVVIFAVSILQYELLEKTLLRASDLVVLCVCVTLIALILPQCIVSDGILQFHSKNKLVALNEEYANCINIMCNFDPEITKYFPRSTKQGMKSCTFDGTGSLTVFVTGNSFALRQIHAVKAAFRGRFKKMYFMARPGCVIYEHLNALLTKVPLCDELINRFPVFMKEIRPDITIVIQRLFFGILAKQVTLPKDVKKESVVLEMKRVINTFSNFTRKLIIVEPHGTTRHNPAQKMAQMIKTGQPLNNYYLSKKDYYYLQKYAWWRQLAAMEGCQNCMVINQTNAFCHEKTRRCDIYDQNTKLSLFCDSTHLSIAGIKRVQPLYETAIDQVLKELT